jgi:uncharacterized membrane protein YkvA (DUF1232 family)
MSLKKEKVSQSFDRAKKKAEKVMHDPGRLSRLLETSKSKIRQLDLGENEFYNILDTIRTFIRMLRAFRSGQYDAIPWVTILMIVAALIYFVTPLDLLPDFIPITGYVDDFTLIMAIFNRFKEDITAFQAWENSIKN